MSTEIVPWDSDRFELMEEVAKLRMQGLSDTAVAKKLGVQRKTAIALFDEYKEVIKTSSESRDRAADTLNITIEHYDGLIKRYYDLLDELGAEPFSHQVAAQINSALKQIADLEYRRVDMLQKAGLLDGSAMGDELAEMEEKQAILIDILRNDLCPNCRQTVVNKLQKVTQVVEATVVYDDE